MLTLALLGCDPTDKPGDTGGDTDSRYHPDGWSDPTVHGMEAKHQDQACTSCHGADLTGIGDALSCDTCHTAGTDAWRTDCTFCHGGENDSTGAPPEGIDNETDESELTFPAHTAHVQATSLHVAFDCVQCHVKPTDVLSDGHLFVGDTTPAVADLTFVAGLSQSAAWDGGGCSNLYCHGNGQGDNGAVEATASVECGDCHAVAGSGESALERMSGEHDEHVEEGVRCAECHGEVVDASNAITDVSLHVDGSVSVALPGEVTRDGSGRCTGSCHGEGHSSESWD